MRATARLVVVVLAMLLALCVGLVLASEGPRCVRACQREPLCVRACRRLP